MKALSVISLLIISACSSHQFHSPIPAFHIEKVCSDESLLYLKKPKPLTAPKRKSYSEDEIHPRMLSLEPSVRKCYGEEMEKTNKHHAFNLCLVVGYDPKG